MHPYDDQRLLGVRARARGSWLQRVLLGVAAISLALVAFFFLTIALIAGALLALAIGARWWWVLRKLRRQAKASEALEGEYTVLERVDTSRHLER
jgi:hypothetical protein